MREINPNTPETLPYNADARIMGAAGIDPVAMYDYRFNDCTVLDGPFCGARIQKPYVTVRMFSPDGHKVLDCVSILDTGSTVTVFPASFARELGLDLDSMPSQMHSLSYEPDAEGKVCTLRFQVRTGDSSGPPVFYEGKVLFSGGKIEVSRVGCIGVDFFEKYPVLFNHPKGKFHLIVAR